MTAQKTKKTPRCIVAIGGSAGALEAFDQFFRSLPHDVDATYVVLQHMDPTQKSHLAELLQQMTDLPVHQIKNGDALQSGHIYVLEPGTTLGLNGAVFVSRKHADLEERRYPIDHFFSSLSTQYGSHAVGIVLSGTGTDGTNGLRLIQEAGGRTLVQAPNEARYGGMPESAISAGVADQVLPAARIAKSLSGLVECRSGAISEQEHSTELALICETLRRKTGHDFSSYKKSTVARRVERRLHANLMPSLAAYLEFLEKDAAEPRALLRDLLIGVTQFFRDPEAFESLKQFVIPKLFEQVKPSETVRVWVPACATGEEAYTIAILLRDFQRNTHRTGGLQIFATDIDRAALEYARQGIYSSKISENVSKEYMSRYFIPNENGYQVTQDLKEICIFSEHSLLKNPPFSKIDLISCRNLFIYWEPELQNKILPLFHYALNSSGYLFLGPAENVTATTELFKPIEKKARIFQKINAAIRNPLSFPISNFSSSVSLSAEHHSRNSHFGEREPTKLISSLLLEDFAPPAFVIHENGEIAFFSGKTKRYLEPPTGAPTNNIFDIIAKPLRPELHALVHRCIKTRESFSNPSTAFEEDGQVEAVKITVRPLGDPNENLGFYLVVLQQVLSPTSKEEALKGGITIPSESSIVQQLQEQLKDTRDHLQNTIEEVKSSNEELLSMNEELQSANEELQTSKEELQSTNEELETVNAELSKKVDELDSTNSDLQNFLQGAQVPILFLDREFKIQKFTPTSTRIFRLIPADLGRKISDIASLLEERDFTQDFESVLQSLQPIERELRTKDQSAWFIMRVSPYRTVGNLIAGIVVSFSDVTELKRAEHTRSTLAAIVESTADAIVGRDLEGQVTSWNGGAERIFQYTAAEAVGKPITLIIPDDKIDEYRMLTQKAIQGGMSQTIDTERIRKDHARISVSKTLSPIREQNGKIVGLSVIYRDISEKKKADRAIQRSHEQLVDVLETMGDAFCSVDSNWTITHLNSNYEQLAQITRGQFLGKNLWELFPEAKGTKHWSELHHVMESRMPTRYEEYYEPLKIWTESNAYATKEGGISIFSRDITRRKASEEHAREANEQFRTLADSIANLAWIAHADGSVYWYNQRWYDYTGSTPEQMEGWGWKSIHHPKYLSEVLEKWEKAISDGEAFELTSLLKGKDECFHWFLTYVTPIKNSQGKVVRWFGTSTNVDEQLRAREAVEKSEQRLDLALQAARMGTFDWNFSTKEIQWSEQTAIHHGIRLEDFRGNFEHAEKLTHPDDHQEVMRVIEQSMQTGNSFECEYRVIWPKDHSIHWLYAYGKVLLDDHGKAERCVGAVLDITDHKRAEIESSKFAAIVKSSNDAIISKGLDSIISSWNEAATALFGYIADEMIGKSIKTLIPLDRQHEEDMILDAISRGERIRHYETVRLRKDGSQIQVSISVSPIKDAKGKIVGAAKIARDISLQKKTETALREAVQARDEFLSLASHELKTPLTSLWMQAQIRQKRIQKNDLEFFTLERLQKMIQGDVRQINRLNRLIDDMLDIGRINSGRLVLKLEKTELIQVVREVIERFANEAKAASCKILIDAQENVEGLWDPFRLDQVITNLIGNAIKYGAGKPISVSLGLENNLAILTVKDQGAGIAKIDQERIFGQFERAVGKSEVSGLGLGLYIAKQIVAAHGGEISVKSEINQGSQFIVRLPLQAKESIV